MALEIITDHLSNYKGEVIVNPLAAVKGLYGRTNRALLALSNNQDYDDLLAKNPLVLGSFFLSGGYGSSFQQILNYVVPLKNEDPSLNLLHLAYMRLMEFLDKSAFSEVYVPFLGLDKGYAVSQERKIAHQVVGDFAEKHPKMHLVLLVPLLGKEEIAPSRVVLQKHLPLKIENQDYRSYWQYLERYIEKRVSSGYPIEGILDGQDLQKSLLSYAFTSSQISKWKTHQKGKQKGSYYPQPSKKNLFLITLLLEMSMEEAEDTFFTFGYGLSKFNPVEAYYLDVLGNSPRLSIDEVNSQLIKQFSPMEGFWK